MKWCVSLLALAVVAPAGAFERYYVITHRDGVYRVRSYGVRDDGKIEGSVQVGEARTLADARKAVEGKSAVVDKAKTKIGCDPDGKSWVDLTDPAVVEVRLEGAK